MSPIIDYAISKSNFRWINLFHESPSAYVIGNSRGVNTITEDIFNKTCNIDVLNLSFNGLKPSEIYHLSKFIPTDKTLIVEISSFLHNLDYKVDKFRFSSIKQLRVYSDWSTTVFPLLHYNNDLTLRLIFYLFNNDKSWVNNGELSEKEIKLYRAKLQESLYSTDKLNEFIDFLESRDQNYVLYHAPIHPAYREKITNIDEILSEIKTSNPYFLDLSNALNDNQYFADLGHSNKKGSMFLINQICDHLNYH